MTSDSIFDDIIQSVKDETRAVGLEDRTALSCPFTDPEDYTVFFTISTGLVKKKSNIDTDIEVISNEFFKSSTCKMMRRFMNMTVYSGFIEYYDIYECWNLPSFTDKIVYRRVGNIGDWSVKIVHEFMDDSKDNSIDSRSIWQIWIPVKIKHLSPKFFYLMLYFLKTLCPFAQYLVPYEEEHNTFGINLIGNGDLYSNITYTVTGVKRKFLSMIYDEEEDKKKIIYDRRLNSFCYNYGMLKRIFKNCDYLELTRKEYENIMSVTGYQFDSEILHGIEHRIHKRFARYIDKPELENMLMKMTVKDENWSSNRVMFRDKNQRNFEDLPFACYIRQNLSLQHINSIWQTVNDFARHTMIDRFMVKYNLKEVKHVVMAETDERVKCVGLWHGLSENPVSQVYIAFVFKREHIEKICDMIENVYNGFSRDLFKRLLQ